MFNGHAGYATKSNLLALRPCVLWNSVIQFFCSAKNTLNRFFACVITAVVIQYARLTEYSQQTINVFNEMAVSDKNEYVAESSFAKKIKQALLEGEKFYSGYGVMKL